MIHHRHIQNVNKGTKKNPLETCMQSQQNAKQSEEIRFKWRHLTDLDFEIELRSTNKILQLINQLNMID